MIDLSNTSIANCIVHKVGNRVKEEDIILSESELELSEELEVCLIEYFLKQFRTVNETFHFHHEIDLKMNEVFACADKIFENENFIFNSIHIARHMYEQTRHFSIKSGEVFIVLFNDVVFENTITKAIGIFKSERKDSFLKVSENNKEVTIRLEKGINSNKLDKGCLILNDNYADGFRVFTYEQNNADTDYWRFDFLSIKSIDDKLSQTSLLINLCKEFSDEYVKKTYGKQEQVSFLDHSLKYISKLDSINVSRFEKDVFPDEMDREFFVKFKKEYLRINEIDLPKTFEVAKNLVTIQKKKIKNEIKLDTNVLIKFEGNDLEATQRFIEKGYDNKRKMNFYKLFYNLER